LVRTSDTFVQLNIQYLVSTWCFRSERRGYGSGKICD